MLKKIKEKLSDFISKLAPLLRIAKFTAVASVAGLLGFLIMFNLVSPLALQSLEAQKKRNAYSLTVLAQFGPMLVAADRVMVTDVSYQIDGSLCFRELNSGQYGCAKVQQYYLKQIELK